MPSEELPLDERENQTPSPPSSSTSGNGSRNGSMDYHPNDNNNDNNNGNEDEGQRVEIMNVRNINRNGLNNPRPLRFMDRPVLPAPVRYYPIIIPSEPTIEELLQQASGTRELGHVSEVKLKVISHMTSLQRIPLFMPNLKRLILEGSIVLTLRDLGCDMSCLVYLNVSRCSLKSLDGTNGLETLEELVADHNMIEEVGPCTNLVMVKKISLKGNKITDLGGVTFLALCENLTTLDLRENFVTEHTQYRHTLKMNIPNLRCLDEVPFSERMEPTSLSSSEYKSSTSSDNEEEQKFEYQVFDKRPAFSRAFTCKERSVTVEVLDPVRPASADPIDRGSNLMTSGAPFCGNIITKARRNRRQRTAWGESTSDSMSSSDSSYSKEFPDRLPQNSVDLELGVIGISTNSAAIADDSQSLLQAARMWRQRSAQTRESIRDSENERILEEQFRLE